MNLDLGSGPQPIDGFVGVDLCGTAKWADLDLVDVVEDGRPTGRREPRPGQVAHVDLRQFPWPFETGSVERVWCAHYLQYQSPEEWVSFCDELYRVLRADGLAQLVWPNLRTGRAFQDPLARDHIPLERWSYANAEWRNKHLGQEWMGYPTCNLVITEFSWEGLHDDFHDRAEDAKQWAAAHLWDMAADSRIVLQAVK